MNWQAYRWVWRLESPLFIGMPPAGSLNRCRCYVPARTLAGALAAELARRRCPEGTSPDYGKFGHELGTNCRLTYLYPAQKVNGEYLAWLPRYQKDTGGLAWQLQDPTPDKSNDPIPDRQFRRCLMSSRAGTAIDPSTDSAAEATLHETECLGPSWRTSPLNPESEPEPVFLVGYIFLRNNSFFKQFSETKTLFLGGDTRYGLGRVSLQDEISKADSIFDKKIEMGHVIETDLILGHAPANINGKDLHGAQEMLWGWHLKKAQTENVVYWVPGSRTKDCETWSIDNYGRWIIAE